MTPAVTPSGDQREPGSAPPASSADCADPIADRPRVPDIVVSRGDDAFEISISRRGIRKLVALLAIAASSAVGWIILTAIPAPEWPGASVFPVAVVAPSDAAPTEPAASPAIATGTPVQVASPTASPMAPPTAARNVRPSPAGPVDLAPSRIPVTEGYVLSTDGRTTDVRFTWEGPAPYLSGDWSFEAWLRPSSRPEGTIYAEAPGGATGLPQRLVWIDGSDVWAALTGPRRDGAAVVAREGAAWSPGSWHHLAVAWAGGDPLIVIDGTSAPTTASAGHGASPADVPGGDALIVPGESSRGFVGDIDEIRIWSLPRPTRELASASMARLDRATPGLVRYFPISSAGGRGSAVADATGTGEPLRVATGARWVPAAAPDPASRSTPSPTPDSVRSVPTPTVVPTAARPLPEWDRVIVAAALDGAGLPDAWTLGGDAAFTDDGWLRLADGLPMRLGSVRYDRDVPLGAGITIRLEYRAGGGDGPMADGLVAFLWDRALGPFTLGRGAGSLGYARYCSRGLSGAILGVGIDWFGSFASSEPTCHDGSLPRLPSTVTIRGPGSGTVGYSRVATAPLRRAATGAPGQVQVLEVTISVWPHGTVTVATRYPNEVAPTAEIVDARFMPGGQSLPAVAGFGVAASTGGLVATHDVRNVRILVGPT